MYLNGKYSINIKKLRKKMINVKPTKEQLDNINLFTRRNVDANETYVFSMILCNTNIDEEYEVFDTDALLKLGDLLIGKTADSKPARIFSTEVYNTGCTDFLKIFAYTLEEKMLQKIENSGTNRTLGCSIEKTCSICGEDISSKNCKHTKGKIYSGKLCYHILSNPANILSWDF